MQPSKLKNPRTLSARFSRASRFWGVSSAQAKLRAMSTEELAQDISGWHVGTKEHWLALWEVERRREFWNHWRSWLAIVISVVALVVAGVKHG